MFGMQSRIERACLIGLLGGPLTDHRRCALADALGRADLFAVVGVEAQRDASVLCALRPSLLFGQRSGLGRSRLATVRLGDGGEAAS